MKRTLIITALFLGISVVGFSQTMEMMEEAVIVEKFVGHIDTDGGEKDITYIVLGQSGKLLESLPSSAQKAIGENVHVFYGSRYNDEDDDVNKIGLSGGAIDITW
ncbi:MAG: hypothetical protein JKX95_08820, partial [Bacteroidia bacterium]|nr:hypothetical protein [Bacteroidia bacterium]